MVSAGGVLSRSRPIPISRERCWTHQAHKGWSPSSKRLEDGPAQLQNPSRCSTSALGQPRRASSQGAELVCEPK